MRLEIRHTNFEPMTFSSTNSKRIVCFLHSNRLADRLDFHPPANGQKIKRNLSTQKKPKLPIIKLYCSFSGFLPCSARCQLIASLSISLAIVKTRTPSTIEKFVNRTDSSFTQAVIGVPLSSKFKMLSIKMFDRTKDPLDHLKTYKALMQLQAILGKIMCSAFLITLKGVAKVWFNRIQPSTISFFVQLNKLFVGHYTVA